MRSRRSVIRLSTESAHRCCAVPSRRAQPCSLTRVIALARRSESVAVGRRPDSDFLFGLIPPIYYAAGYARVDLGGWYNLTRHVTAYANLNNAFNNHYNEVLGYPALKANFRAGLRFRLGGE